MIDKDLLYMISINCSDIETLAKLYKTFDRDIPTSILEIVMKRPKIQIIDFDYVVIQCGYTNRLSIKNLEKINDDDQDDDEDDEDYGTSKFLYAFNRFCCKHSGYCDKQNCSIDLRLTTKKKYHQIANKVHTIVKKNIPYGNGYSCGSVVYKCQNSFGSALHIIKKLIKLNHCAMFYIDTLCLSEYIIEDDIKIMYLSFDTESG
jgi:hypothetical protein